MPTPDPRIDAYLAQAAPFARPILAELRARIHAVCPEAEETLKWKATAFTYRGKLLAVMAAFLKETGGDVVLSENGPEGPGGNVETGLSRAMVVLDYLLSLQDLDRQRFSIAAESIAPPEGAGGSAVTYHRDERMLEVVLLEGSVPK